MSTAIEWTDETWNPTVGCDQISPGCANCYAKTLHDKRHRAFLDGAKLAVQYAEPFETLQLKDDRLTAPLHWRAPRRVFVNSVSDLFHEAVPDAFIDRVFAVMALAPQHTFQVLTKRADRMRAYFSDAEHRQGQWAGALHEYLIGPGGNTHEQVERWCKSHGMTRAERERRLDIVNGGGGWHFFRQNWPLKNVCLGVSVENQHFADERIPLLLDTPAAVRFISAEPLLADVDLFAFLATSKRNECLGILGGHKGVPGLDWVIVGGESGTGARPFDVAWARAIVAQCKAAGVPVFVKQLGGRAETDSMADLNGHIARGPRWLVLKGKGGDPAEWPEDLRVREFPKVAK